MFTTTSSGAEAWIRHLAGRFGRIVSLGYYLEDSGDGLEDPVRVGEWLRWVLEFRPTPEAQSAAAGGGGSDQCAGGAGESGDPSVGWWRGFSQKPLPGEMATTLVG